MYVLDAGKYRAMKALEDRVARLQEMFESCESDWDDLKLKLIELDSELKKSVQNNAALTSERDELLRELEIERGKLSEAEERTEMIKSDLAVEREATKVQAEAPTIHSPKTSEKELNTKHCMEITKLKVELSISGKLLEASQDTLEKEKVEHKEELEKERAEISRLHEVLDRKDAELKELKDESARFIGFVDLYRESERENKRINEEKRTLDEENRENQRRLSDCMFKIRHLESSVVELKNAKWKLQDVVGMLQDKLYYLSKGKDQLEEKLKCFSDDNSSCTSEGARVVPPAQVTSSIRPLWRDSTVDDRNS